MQAGFQISSAEAILNTVQMVLTNLAAPFWGILADRGALTDPPARARG